MNNIDHTTRSGAYYFAKNAVIPEVLEIAKTMGSERFYLRSIVDDYLAMVLTPEQADYRIPFKHSATSPRRFAAAVAELTKTIITSNKLLNKVEERGMWKAWTEEEENEAIDDLIDEMIENENDDEFDGEGWIYAYSYKEVIKENVPFKIKIGKAALTVGVEQRVKSQVKSCAVFSNPTILFVKRVKKYHKFETTVHDVLKTRGKHVEDAPGKEWFVTTVAELSSIVDFIGS